MFSEGVFSFSSLMSTSFVALPPVNKKREKEYALLSLLLLLYDKFSTAEGEK